MRSYRPEELFDEQGRPRPQTVAIAPEGERRMGSNPHANGGTLGTWLRDVMVANVHTFRVFGPDETASNRLGSVLEVTDRASMAQILPTDDHVSPDGRVMEILSGARSRR
jgi:xylulose-5-phosphate/fructose-6-phosphate phosphoketolase